VSKDSSSSPPGYAEQNPRSLSPAVAFSPAKHPPISRLAFNQVTTFRWSLLEDVMAARDVGLSNIGLWRRKLTDFGEERSRELIRDSSLNVSSLSWAGGFTGSHRLSFNEAVADGRTALHLAADIAAECLVVVSGGRAGHTRNHATKLLIEALKFLADEAAERGVALALQPMHAIFCSDWSFLVGLDDVLDVLDRCRHESVKLALDVYHVAEEPQLIERLPEIVPHLALVQLNDGTFPPQSKYDRCQLGDGEIPLTEIVQTLEGAHYEGCYEIALWSRRIWRLDYHTMLRESLSRFDALCRQ